MAGRSDLGHPPWPEEGRFERSRHSDVRLVSSLEFVEPLGPAPLPQSGDAGTSGGIGEAETLASEPEDYGHEFLKPRVSQTANGIARARRLPA